MVDGQKVPIERTRLRTPENREQRLGSYEMFQRSGPMEHAVWDKLMRGLSTRNYGAVVKDFHEAYGVEKSAVSENFIASSREKLQELMERPLGELRLCAVMIDGTPFRDRQMIVALGINVDGCKTVLGLRDGATENAAVVSELLGDLAARGAGLQRATSVRARRRQGAGGGGASSCGRGRIDPTMSGAQAAQCDRPLTRGT